jgi:predicted Ser/Thr protein kinase
MANAPDAGIPAQGAPSPGVVTRAVLARAPSLYIVKGAWNKADLLRVTLAGHDYAVKDYAAKPWPVRWSGALQLRREASAYGRLEGVAGVPRYFGRIDRHAIVMEFVAGIRLPKFHRRHGGVPRVAERVRALVDSIHARGVIHGDLRSRDNILVTPAGHLFLIDFSSAHVFDAATWSGRVLFPRLRRAEQRALLKWKVALAPQELTEAELAAHRRFKRLRWFWPFNRKQDLPRTRGRNPLL